MKKLLVIIALLSFGVSTQAQQEYGLHFMRNVWNSNYTNPGFMPYQTFFVGGVSAGAGLSLKGLGSTPIFVKEADGRFTPNYQEIIDNVDEDFRIRNSLTFDEFAIGFKVKKLFFSLNTATKVTTQVNLPKDLFELAWYGNEPFIGQTVDFGPSFSIDAYQELALGINYTFNRKFSAGIRVKRLVGLASAYTEQNTFALTTGSNHYEVGLEADYLANISSPFLNVQAPEDGKLLNTQADFNQTTLDNTLSDLRRGRLPSGNDGLAADIGASINLKDRLELGISILDLGYINWNNGVSGLRTSGEYEFSGLTFNEIVNGNSVSFSPLYDTVQNILTVESATAGSFRKTLFPKVYLSALGKYGYWQLGGMFYSEFTNDGIISSIGLSGRYVISSKLSFGAVYAYHDGRFDNLGVNSTFRLGPLQFHILVDNVLPIFRPERFEYTNIRAGFNIVFGTKKMKKIRQGRFDEPELPDNSEVNLLFEE